MRYQRLIGIALLVGLLAISFEWHGKAADEQGGREASRRQAIAKARMKAAKQVLEFAETNSGFNLSKDPERFYRWSIRILEAERELDPIAALRAHRDRMAALAKSKGPRHEEGDVSPESVRDRMAAAEEKVLTNIFFTLEAESWLMAAEAERK